ncbi:5-FTHF_cyc-lig domain-containing protein [Cephalotus follicularis]|uniref:5-formyltetrahydrofolate cyclo-ligase n=1 Tax=Cephalotus follicularis TaxID=3775 RepID=A0A1Q3C2P3_CEPFO|nr:5-FTHF_cyc-lig domain-containing protein [Cephalotus follicularis]
MFLFFSFFFRGYILTYLIIEIILLLVFLNQLQKKKKKVWSEGIMWSNVVVQRIKAMGLMAMSEQLRTTTPTAVAAKAIAKQTHPPRAAAASRSFVSTMSNHSDLLQPIFEQKMKLRSKVRKSLKSMDPALRSQQDDAIQRIVLDSPWFKSCKRLCAYISCTSLREVDTSKLLAEILSNQPKDGDAHIAKRLYVPRVEDNNCYMRMFHISGVDDLVLNSMNILEPAPVDYDGNEREDDRSCAVMQAAEPVDLFLVPGLAFDKSGNRLGRGKGYYDALISKYQELAKERNWRKPLFVALSYSVQIMDEGIIPVTPNDVPIDALVSPSGAIPITPAALDRMNIGV